MRTSGSAPLSIAHFLHPARCELPPQNYVRDPRHLIAVMSSIPSYLQSRTDGEVKNLRDWGLPLGRRFRALRLWFLIRAAGISCLQARLRRDLDNAQWLAAQVRSAALDEHTRTWADAVNRSGQAYLTPAILQDRWMVRVSIGAVATEREDVETLWRIMRQKAEGAMDGGRSS